MMWWWDDASGSNYGGWWGSGLGMVFMMLLFWLPLIGLGVWLVSRVTRPEPRLPGVAQGQPHEPESARAILDRRFATGEITAEQYAQMRRALEQ